MKVSPCDRMGSGLRFLVPDLSVHGNETSVPYTSAAIEAAVIHQWPVPSGMSRLSLGFAASLDGVILFELLRFPNLPFDRLFIEGVSFYSGSPMARVGGAVPSWVMVAKHRKAVRDPETGACKFQHPYGEGVVRSMVASFAAMSEGSVHVVVRDCSHVNLPPLSPAIQRRCTFTYGEKGSDLWLVYRMILRLHPETELHVWPSWGHCERVSRDSATYGAMLWNVALGSASTDRSRRRRSRREFNLARRGG